MTAQARSLPLLAIPEAFTPEELIQIAGLVGDTGNARPLDEMVEQAVAYFAAIGRQKRGRGAWIVGIARYIAWARRRGATLRQVEVDWAENVVDLAEARARLRGER